MSWRDEVDGTTRRSIEEIVAHELDRQTPHYRIGLLIVPHLTLGDEDRLAIAGYARELDVDGVKRPLARRDRMIARFTRDRLRDKATTIAHTISHERYRDRDHRRVQAMLDDGTLDADNCRWEWLGTTDPRCCDRCAAFDRVRKRIGDRYISRSGETASAPPLHDGCRCTETLVQLDWEAALRPNSELPRRARQDGLSVVGAFKLGVRATINVLRLFGRRSN